MPAEGLFTRGNTGALARRQFQSNMVAVSRCFSCGMYWKWVCITEMALGLYILLGKYQNLKLYRLLCLCRRKIGEALWALAEYGTLEKVGVLILFFKNFKKSTSFTQEFLETVISPPLYCSWSYAFLCSCLSFLLFFPFFLHDTSFWGLAKWEHVILRSHCTVRETQCNRDCTFLDRKLKDKNINAPAWNKKILLFLTF